jgi:hypothetical protein
MKKITIWMLLLTYVTIGKAQNDKLLGNWQYTSNGQTERLQFVSQNKLIYNNEASNYVVMDKAIRVTDEYGYYFDYLYVLQNDQLLLTFPDGYQYPFERVKDAPSSGQTVTGAGGSTQALYGNLCSYSGSSGGGSSYSTTRTLYFDGKGRFSYSSARSYSDNNAGLYANDPNALNGRYEVNGKTLSLFYDSGNTETIEVYMVQNSGEITELRAGQTLYGKGLCD